MIAGSIIFGFFVLIFIVLLFLIRSWRTVPEGKIEWKLAVLLRIANGQEDEGDLKFKDLRRYRRRSNDNMLRFTAPFSESAHTEDIGIPGPGGAIPARIYRPAANTPVDDSGKTVTGLPVLMFYHGGGFVCGSIDTHDPLCRKLSEDAGVIIISVEYRLAPEHPFPAAPADSYAALAWAAENARTLGGDPGNISVAGDSAGGNLATVSTILARENGGPKVRFQVLIYPNTNGCFMGMPSHEMYGTGFFLDARKILWYCDQYVPDPAERSHPHASPLKLGDAADLPPALIITAQCDPLRDEGKAYADKLAAAGVPVVYECFPGVTHGFIGMPKVCRAASAATERIVRYLQENKGIDAKEYIHAGGSGE